MSVNVHTLSIQEINWLLDRKVTRLTDNKEVQIYPMGAERYLSSVLSGKKKSSYNLKNQVVDKNVLVIPGFGTSAFLFAQAGAKSITVFDKDPVTLAWIKAFKQYYHYRESDKNGTFYPSIGELLTALTCWYPPYMLLPSGSYRNRLYWLMNPQTLRRVYIFYILTLVQNAITAQVKDEFALQHDIYFHVGEVTQIRNSSDIVFDMAFVPYLLGVKNGIESEHDIVSFMHELMVLVPRGPILVNPSRNTKEFYVIGKRYFSTTSYSTIQKIPALQPYVVTGDHNWFGTQGLAVFCSSPVIL